VALKILSSPPPEPEELAVQLRTAIERAMPGAQAKVEARGAGHFEVEVVSGAFAGLTRVKQQQLVYAAIAPLMAGDSAPVHAIDRMVTRLP
jgi:acid stress-induced BolA-like protein IbaG/YrbA